MLRAAAKEIKNFFGKDLVALILFGSRARSDFRRTSDVDFLAIVRRKRGVKMLERKLFKEFGEVFEIHQVTKNRFKKQTIEFNEILPHIFKFGKVYFDGERFFYKMKNLFEVLHKNKGITIITPKEKIKL